MFPQAGGVALHFGYFGENFSIEPATHQEFVPSGSVKKWQRVVDTRLHELTNRVIAVEKHNQILSRLLVN